MGKAGWPQSRPTGSSGVPCPPPEPCARCNLGLMAKQGPECQWETQESPTVEVVNPGGLQAPQPSPGRDTAQRRGCSHRRDMWP